MSIETRHHDYAEGDVALRATVAWDASVREPRPGVLVSHAWRGRSDFEDARAADLARLGYVGFALDLYGAGVLGSNPEENAALMQPFLDDRAALARRLRIAVDELRALPEVDGERLAAIGYCFGGLCALDLARSDAGLAAAASFHGLLNAPAERRDEPMTTRVLVLHGWDDPLAPPADVLALADEFSARDADWQLHAYGNTLHAFTNPAAQDPANGLQHDPRAARRAWAAMQSFLAESLAPPD